MFDFGAAEKTRLEEQRRAEEAKAKNDQEVEAALATLAKHLQGFITLQNYPSEVIRYPKVVTLKSQNAGELNVSTADARWFEIRIVPGTVAISITPDAAEKKLFSEHEASRLIVRWLHAAHG